MTSSYFAPLVTLPTIIDEEGKYVTRLGDVVTIDMVSAAHEFGCFGEYDNGLRDRWHKSGRIFATRESDADIIKRN